MDITQKQLAVIKMIEMNLGIQFTGSTKHEASLFIAKNITASKYNRRLVLK